MKLIIDIPDEDYEFTKGAKTARFFPPEYYVKLILNGTPLDDVKAIMEKQIERDFAYAETETFKVPCHYGTANGLQVAVRILDNIGKSESEDKNERVP